MTDANVIDPELVQRVLREATRTGGRLAEVFAEDRSTTSLRLDDGRIEEVVTGRDRGAGIRVFHGDSQAYAHTNRLDEAALLEAAAAAASAARDGRRPHGGSGATDGGVRSFDLSAAGPILHPVPEPADDVPREAKVAWLGEADDAARAIDASVRQVVVVYFDSRQRVLIVDSDGLWVEEERPRIRLFVSVVAARDGVLETGSHGPAGLGGAELFQRHPPAATAERAARQAVTMLGGRAAPAGEMAVVLGPGGGGVLFHEACGHGLEADHIQKDASVFKGRLGDRLASPLVNGIDDGSIEGAWGSFAVDDEGAAAERTVLFEDGVLVNYLYDRLRAEHDGRPSTGNGRRQSHAHLPIPRMSNSYILPGEDEAEAILAGTPRGLYARTLGGGQVNPANGDFVFGVAEGYLIEDGHLTSPVRGANLIGNGPDILAAIDAVAGDFETWDGVCGKEGQGVPVGAGSPTLRVARMTVGGTDA